MCQGPIVGATEEPERGRRPVSWESALEKRGWEGGSLFPQNNKLPSPYIVLDTFPILPSTGSVFSSHFSGEKNGKLDKNGTVGYAFPMIMRPHAAPSILNLLNHQVSENCYTRNSQSTPESAGVCNNHYTSFITTARETLEKKSSLDSTFMLLHGTKYKSRPILMYLKEKWDCEAVSFLVGFFLLFVCLFFNFTALYCTQVKQSNGDLFLTRKKGIIFTMFFWGLMWSIYDRTFNFRREDTNNWWETVDESANAN